MAYTQKGIPFNLKEDWRALFAKDTWFEWQRQYSQDDIILRRFTVWNVFKWYIIQFVIAILLKTLHPLVLFADKFYWNNLEGYDMRTITGREMRQMVVAPKYFRLDK